MVATREIELARGGEGAGAGADGGADEHPRAGADAAEDEADGAARAAADDGTRRGAVALRRAAGAERQRRCHEQGRSHFRHEVLPCTSEVPTPGSATLGRKPPPGQGAAMSPGKSGQARSRALMTLIGSGQDIAKAGSSPRKPACASGAWNAEIW